MTPDATLIVELMLLGLGTGFLAGLLGVGGGLMMVPFLTYLLTVRGIEPGLAVKLAIATSMATIVFTSLSSVRAHHGKGAVRWPIVFSMAPGILAGAMLASMGVFAVIQGAGLALVFAGFVAFAATQMLRPQASGEGGTLPGPLGRGLVGTLIGFASGLVGAGGGFISVPYLSRCQVPVHQAIGTSAALGFPIALFNSLGYVAGGWGVADLPTGSLGYIYLPALAAIAVASVAMAPVGARTAHRMPVARLKRAFATLLYGLAAYMLYHGLTHV